MKTTLVLISMLVGCSSADFTVAPSVELAADVDTETSVREDASADTAVAQLADTAASETSQDGASSDSLAVDTAKPTVTENTIPNTGTLSPPLSCAGDDVVTNVPRAAVVRHFDIGIKWYGTASCGSPRHAQISAEGIILDTVEIPSAGQWTYHKIDKEVMPQAGFLDLRIKLVEAIDKCGASSPACNVGGYVRPMDGSYVKLSD